MKYQSKNKTFNFIDSQINTNHENERIAEAHQIFYDITGIEISISIDRAIKKILKLI